MRKVLSDEEYEAREAARKQRSLEAARKAWKENKQKYRITQKAYKERKKKVARSFDLRNI